MGKVKRERSVLKGALAGLAGGIAGAGAKMLAERIYPPVARETPPFEPGDNLETAAKPWVLGAVTGAAYGAAIEIEPRAGVWQGAGFGLAMRKFAHQAMPLQAEEPALTLRQKTHRQQSEWVSYAVFGVVTEAVRRLVRKGL